MKKIGRLLFFTLIIPAILSLGSIASAQSIKAKETGPHTLDSLKKVNERATTVEGSPTVSAAELAEFRKALTAPDPNPILLNNIGVHLGLAGRYEDADDFMEEALQRAPSEAAYSVNLAIVKIHLGENARALELLRKAAEIDPSYTRTQSVLCDLLTTSLLHKEAIECFEGRLAREDLEPVSVSNYAMSLMETGKLGKGLSLLKKAAKVYPNDPGIMNGLAIGLYRSKEYTDCIQVLTKLVKVSPDRPQYRFNLAVALVAAKERSDALEQYDLLKRSDPKLAREVFRLLFGRNVVDAGRANRL